MSSVDKLDRKPMRLKLLAVLSVTQLASCVVTSDDDDDSASTRDCTVDLLIEGDTEGSGTYLLNAQGETESASLDMGQSETASYVWLRDEDGRVVAIEEDGAQSYAYEWTSGLLTSTTRYLDSGEVGRQTDYSWREDGLLDALIVTMGGGTNRFDLDYLEGAVTTIEQSLSGEAFLTRTVAWTAAGCLDSVQSEPGSAVNEYEVDALGRLLSLAQDFDGDGVVDRTSTLTYTGSCLPVAVASDPGGALLVLRPQEIFYPVLCR